MDVNQEQIKSYDLLTLYRFRTAHIRHDIEVIRNRYLREVATRDENNLVTIQPKLPKL